MIKFNKNIWFLIALVGVSLAACKDDDTEISTITSFEKFTFSSLPAPREVPEADAVYTIDFAFDEKQIMDLHVSIAPSSASTATEDEDYTLSTHEVSVGALGGGGSFDIHVLPDFEAEGDETIVLHLGGSDAFGLPTAQEVLVLTIRDSIYPVAVSLDWEGSFQYAGSTFTLCPNVDIDLFLVDDQGAFAGGFGGATAACPERMFTGSLANGDYSIIANLYGNGLFGAPGIDTIPIPMRVSLFKGGVVSDSETTVRYTATDFASVPTWTAYTPSDPNGDALATVGTVRVGNDAVTLLDPDGGTVGTIDK